jgi:hypothetical protein
MTVPLSRMVALAFAVLVLGAATTASARPKKQSAEHTATTTTNCHGTPLIMQGMDCPTRPVRAAEQELQQEEEQEQATKRAERPRLTARGSGGPYIAPVQRTPSLTLTQPSTGPYIPPPISNPSAQINQLNQSFPLNGGLGNNPTNRDAYIRYNLTR